MREGRVPREGWLAGLVGVGAVVSVLSALWIFLYLDRLLLGLPLGADLLTAVHLLRGRLGGRLLPMVAAIGIVGSATAIGVLGLMASMHLARTQRAGAPPPR